MSQALMTQYRAEFASMCISRRLYLMFSLLMQASLRYDESIPTACVGYSPVSGFTITFGKKFVEAGLLPFTFVLAHELRHVVQMGTAPDLSQFSRRTLLNIAMDASLHEDLRLLLPDEWKAILAMDGFRPCSVEGLESDLRAIEARLSVPPDKSALPLQRNQEFVYYYNAMLQVQNELRKSSRGGQFDLGSSLDEHNLDDMPAELARELVRKSLENSKRMAARAGRSAADDLLEFDKNVELVAKTKKAIENLRVKTIRLSQAATTPDPSYARISRIDADSHGIVKVASPKRQVVLLLDTSGSMCDKVILSQLAAAAKMLQKQNKLIGAFSFDADLYDITLDTNGNAKDLRGGGGTSISDAMLDRLERVVSGQSSGTSLRAHGNKGKASPLDIVLLTDGAIDWECDKNRHRFHQIIV